MKLIEALELMPNSERVMLNDRKGREIAIDYVGNLKNDKNCERFMQFSITMINLRTRTTRSGTDIDVKVDQDRYRDFCFSDLTIKVYQGITIDMEMQEEEKQ